MTNQQMTEEMKTLMDEYISGELKGQNLRRLRNMLFILTDDVTYSIEQQNKSKQKDLAHAAI